MAVVGGDTLLARELRELLADAKPAPRVELVSGIGELVSEDESEAVTMVPLTKESFAGSAVAFLAGSPAVQPQGIRRRRRKVRCSST